MNVSMSSSAIKSHGICWLLFVVTCRNSISWEKSEELKQEHCYIAEDYHEELSIFQVSIPS